MSIAPGSSGSSPRLVGLALALASLAACGGSAQGALEAPTAPSTAATPETPAGEVVRVRSSGDLEDAVRNLRSGQTIELAPGTYNVPGEALYLPEPLANVAIVGASGNRDDVRIRGGRFSIWVNNVNGLTVRDLTLEGASEHGIILNCAAHAPIVRNVVLRDIGDQFIKANPGPGGCGVDAGIVEDSLFEYTRGAPDTYTNGVDVHFGTGWIVRRNTFRNFVAAGGGLVGPAVLLWNASRDSVVENNTFTDNVRDISFGLDATMTSRAPVSNGALPDHRGGRITGNTITRRAGLPGVDVAISVADSPDTRVEGNAITMAGGYPNAIEYRFPRTTGVVITGNTVDALIQARDGATATVSGNTVR
ncbi:MAG TPA: right-handed parallel beta-helix repeat-containing protein [Vicinamibacterales bacterium]|nr:right-handed parallel beta-helix repeat-containing protein [Vicinamibacterales bacterium]